MWISATLVLISRSIRYEAGAARTDNGEALPGEAFAEVGDAGARRRRVGVEERRGQLLVAGRVARTSWRCSPARSPAPTFDQLDVVGDFVVQIL